MYASNIIDVEKHAIFDFLRNKWMKGGQKLDKKIEIYLHFISFLHFNFHNLVDALTKEMSFDFYVILEIIYRNSILPAWKIRKTRSKPIYLYFWKRFILFWSFLSFLLLLNFFLQILLLLFFLFLFFSSSVSHFQSFFERIITRFNFN